MSERLATPGDIVALAKEMNEAIELLEECSELLDGYADADCTGDPPKFQPNKAMVLRERIEEWLKGSANG